METGTPVCAADLFCQWQSMETGTPVISMWSHKHGDGDNGHALKFWVIFAINLLFGLRMWCKEGWRFRESSGGGCWLHHKGAMLRKMMRVFYHPSEQHYRPSRTWFHGRIEPNPEVVARTQSILNALEQHPNFAFEEPPNLDPTKDLPLLAEVHDEGYLNTLKTVCERLDPEEEFFPFMARPDKALLKVAYPRVRMGYYAVDGSMPLLTRSFTTALGAAASALAGAKAVLSGEKAVYSLCRPPGHHASRASYSGYCLLNNAALAAQRLSKQGKTAILDVDFHHGNGVQEIFYAREDVLYASLHGDPRQAYPFILGDKTETGNGAGLGCNHNFPLPKGCNWSLYAPALEDALERIAAFSPDFLVVGLGFDTYAKDPIGFFKLEVLDFAAIGARLAQLQCPTLVVQEGGYCAPELGDLAVAFFRGFGH